MTSKQLDLIRQCRAIAGAVRVAGGPVMGRVGHGFVLGMPDTDALDHIYMGKALPKPSLHLDGVVLIGVPRP